MSVAPRANECVTPQSSKVCVVTVSIIYLFTRLPFSLQFSACLSNSIIDWEPAASGCSAGLLANCQRPGGLTPGSGEGNQLPAARLGAAGGGAGGGARRAVARGFPGAGEGCQTLLLLQHSSWALGLGSMRAAGLLRAHLSSIRPGPHFWPRQHCYWFRRHRFNEIQAAVREAPATSVWVTLPRLQAHKE